MPALQTRIEAAKATIASYFTPPPPEEEAFGSVYIGMVDYFIYEGADVRDILDEITLVIADALVVKNARLEAKEEGGCVIIICPGMSVYLNLTWRVKEEWTKGIPRAEALAERVYSDLRQQFRENSTEPF